MSGYLDIIFLLIMVIFIFGKLKSVLGTGGEDTRVIMIPKEQFNKVYSELKKSSLDNKIMINLENLSPLDRELAKIPNFNKNAFIKGAQKAFEMISSAFSKGDVKTLSTLVNAELMKKFDMVIQERKNQGIVSEMDLINFVETEVEAVHFCGEDKVNLVVRFVSEQVNLLKDAEGNVLEGDENYVQKILDVWTFEKNLNPRFNNWLLCSTKKC